MRRKVISSKSLLLITSLLGVLITLLLIIELTLPLEEKIKETPVHTTASPTTSKDVVGGLAMVSYVRTYTLKEAYDTADLVILGRIIYSEHYAWNIKRPYRGKTLTFERPYIYHRVKIIKVFKGNPISNVIIVAQFGGMTSRGLVIVPEDPPMEEDELVILFLCGPHERGDYVKYPGIEYCYMGVFGRFKVINDRVYSAMYFLPEEIGGIPCRKAAEDILKDLEGYKDVNGITIEKFLKLVKG